VADSEAFERWERRGAVFSLRDDETLRCDLDRAAVTSHAEAERLAAAVLNLRDEIRAVLLGQRRHH